LIPVNPSDYATSAQSEVEDGNTTPVPTSTRIITITPDPVSNTRVIVTPVPASTSEVIVTPVPASTSEVIVTPVPAERTIRPADDPAMFVPDRTPESDDVSITIEDK
jgi:hypothetical protein